jgi:hypothetical protein
LRVVEAGTGIIRTIAGNGARGQSPDGPALSLSLMGPRPGRPPAESRSHR